MSYPYISSFTLLIKFAAFLSDEAGRCRNLIRFELGLLGDYKLFEDSCGSHGWILQRRKTSIVLFCTVVSAARRRKNIVSAI